jgi:excisionase family DNA binding protein
MHPATQSELIQTAAVAPQPTRSGYASTVMAGSVPPSAHGYASIKQACGYTGVCRTLLNAKIRVGELPARKVGRRVLIAWLDLVTWVESQPLAANPRLQSATQTEGSLA